MERETHLYEIGGISCRMTEGQADRWNSGGFTEHMLSACTCHDPDGNRYITLRRATCHRLEPELAGQMIGMPANRID